MSETEYPVPEDLLDCYAFHFDEDERDSKRIVKLIERIARAEAQLAAAQWTIEALSKPVTDEELFHFTDEQIRASICGTDFLVSRVLRKLAGMTGGEKWSLYRAVVKLALASRARLEAIRADLRRGVKE